MSIEMAPSPLTPHPRDTHERLRRIKFPISNAKTAAISMDSPLARALLRKCVEDEVAFDLDGKTITMRVVSISYQPD